MKYRVIWTSQAEAELAEIWLEATDREAVNAAAATIDRLLEDRPLDERHEVVNGFGTTLQVPVGVDFGIDPKNRLVVVVAAWFAVGDSD